MIYQELVECFYEFFKSEGLKEIPPFLAHNDMMAFCHYDCYFWIQSGSKWFQFGPEAELPTDDPEFKYYLHEYASFEDSELGYLNTATHYKFDFRESNSFDILKQLLHGNYERALG